MNVKNVYLWNYLQRIINALGGVLLVLIISVFYELDVAGEFYAFYSLLGIVAIFEFGYAVLIVQRISIYSTCDFSALNADLNRDMLHYLTLVKYFIGFFLVVFPLLSYLILNKVFSGGLIIIIPLTLALGLNMLLSMTSNFIEGLGHIEKISRIRTIQAVFSYGSLLTALLLGFGASAIIFQLAFQIGIFLILIVGLLNKGLPGVLPIADVFKLPNYSEVKVSTFKKDFNYSFQLYVTVLAGLFCNQLWVIAVTFNGAVENISKVAMMLQILTAAAGFALTPIASRLAEIAKYHHLGSRDRSNLIVKNVTKDVILATFAAIVVVVSLYYLGQAYYPEKMVSMQSAFLFILSLPLLIATSLVGIITQSRGRRDLLWVSVVRIAIPSVLFLYINETTTDEEIATFYFLATLAAFLVAMVYLAKGNK